MTFEGLELRSHIGADGTLRIGLATVRHGAPGPGDVIIRVEAAPLNPTDHYLLTGPADQATMTASGTRERPELTMTIPAAALPFVSRRVGISMPVGAEGAGTVVAAGAGAEALVGRRVAAMAGGMFTQYRQLAARRCVVLPDSVPTARGAAMFVNPLTVLGFIETMRDEGHSALVHAAAASNLGQMLVKACLADGIPLVNIVRRPEQAAILHGIGAKLVVDSSRPDFEHELGRAVAETGARLAFDPIGGGRLAGQILAAMETASASPDGAYEHYGSAVPKGLYIYGGLDRGPTILERRFGFAWRVGGWLLFHFMARAGAERMAGLQARVLSEIDTTFASRFTRTVSLAQVLDPEVFGAFQAKSTGEKYLVSPSADV